MKDCPPSAFSALQTDVCLTSQNYRMGQKRRKEVCLYINKQTNKLQVKKNIKKLRLALFRVEKFFTFFFTFIYLLIFIDTFQSEIQMRLQ